MKFKELKLQIKEQQKQTAATLKRIRSVRKPSAYAKASKELKAECEARGGWNEYFLKKDYREIHIAYCKFFNNTPYEKIETPRENNKPNLQEIKRLEEYWKSQINEEVVCTDS